MEGYWGLLAQYPALSLQSSSDDIIELLVHETDYKIYKIKAQVHYTDATIQQMCQVRAGPGILYTKEPEVTCMGQASRLKYGDVFFMALPVLFLKCLTIHYT